MEPERWKKVDDLLQSALQVPAAQQDEFLRRECANDTALLREVQSLLKADRAAGHFLAPPGIHLAETATQAEDRCTTPPVVTAMAGKTISHYRVLHELGSGGMGVVYQAEDIKLGRHVAMKFLPSEVASDRLAFERLKREARASSALDHPNICPIYELGEDQGQPFIVMQLLEGQLLREWIGNAAHQDNRLRLKRAMDLAIQIANGLAAAHQKGIIHRDIKPANIFITMRGDAKILDFGLAKLLDDQLAPEVLGETTIADAASPATDSVELHLTRTGTTVGTAYYMSPEQVRGEKLDARTDLFSLGLVLYEMVTSQKAFAGDTGRAVYDAILHRVPTPARQLNPAVPVELERIIDKAVEKDRTLRYGSAQEVVRDLESLLHQTGAAAWWRTSKWIAVAAAILLASAIGIGVLLQRSWHPAGREAGSTLKPRRSVAVLGFHNLSNKTDEDWISTALAEMVSTELAAGQQLRIIPGENVAHMKLDLALSAAGGYGQDTLHKIRKNLGTDVIVQGSYLVSPGSGLRIDMQVQEADAGETIAAVSENGSEGQIAELASRAGAALREKLGISAISTGELNQTRSALPSNPQAARLYSEGLAKMRVFDAIAARDLLGKAIAADPNHALSHSLLAQSLSFLGYDGQALSEAKKAFELSASLPRDSQLLIEGGYRELSNDHPAAIEAYRSLWKFFPDDLDYGLLLVATQRKASLLKDAQATIEQLRKLPEPSRGDPRIDLEEAYVAESGGDFKRSQQISSAAAEKARLRENRLFLAEAMRWQAWSLDRLGDLDRALAADSESRDLAKQVGNLRAVATALNGIGSDLYDKGDLEGARKAYEEAVRTARQTGAQRVISTATANLGNVFYDQGRLAEARPYYQQALAINRQIDNKRGIASDLGNLANVLQGMGDLKGATSAQEQALQAFHDVGDRRGEAVTLANLGDVLVNRGELSSARQKFDESLAMLKQIGFQRGQVGTLLGLAEIFEAHDRLPEAQKSALEALALSKELKDDSDTAQVQWQLAKLALEQGNASEAEVLARASQEEFDREKSVGNGCSSDALLGRALLAQGKLKEAQTATDRALAQCGRSQDRVPRLQGEIASAAVRYKAGGAQEALKTLESVRAETLQSGYGGFELESGLLMGEIEISSGRIVSGRARLETLERDAQSKGFALIARKARAALLGGSIEF